MGRVERYSASSVTGLASTRNDVTEFRVRLFRFNAQEHDFVGVPGKGAHGGAQRARQCRLVLDVMIARKDHNGRNRIFGNYLQ